MGSRTPNSAEPSSKRISRGLNARASLREDDILSMLCERPTISTKGKRSAQGTPFSFGGDEP